MPLVMQQLTQRLKRHKKPVRNYGPVEKKAAVAIGLLATDEGVSLLMIRRAKRAGDPWSGHMGFPGGRRDREDADNLACALRETREELGLDLMQAGELICELGDLNTNWRPDRPEMLITPFVFALHKLPALTPNYEVDSVVWVPLQFLLDRGNRALLKWQWQGESLQSDSYIYQGNQIWGLSLMMLDELMEAAQR
jgi:8-oxo-dGTP pyrophosphatase MutT (NUDIX family)